MRRLYEAMFIVESAKAKENYNRVEEDCRSCITRHGGEIIKSQKWDDRRLCYEIKKVKRGVYILIHFEAEGDAIAKIERQARMSDVVLRLLITRDSDGVETSTGGSHRSSEEESAEAEEA
ncbi:MAG: 30S ribosomal protein S6 [Planctomycetota bacterium]|nr:30S ribosomal protein S6 [Planctomycetota bacterium]